MLYCNRVICTCKYICFWCSFCPGTYAWFFFFLAFGKVLDFFSSSSKINLFCHTGGRLLAVEAEVWGSDVQLHWMLEPGSRGLSQRAAPAWPAVYWCSGGMLLAAAGGFTVGSMLRQKVLQLSFASVTKMARSWGKQKLTFTYNLVVDQGAIRRWAFTQLAIKSQCQWDSVCIASVVV